MTTRIALEECSTLAGIHVLHQAIVDAIANPDPIVIDAGQVSEADFSLVQLLPATQIEAQRCGRELAACEPIARRLRGIASDFVGAAGDAIALPLPDHPLTGLLDAAARSYSMASERVVHNRLLLPGITAAQAGAPPAQMDDDDLLF